MNEKDNELLTVEHLAQVTGGGATIGGGLMRGYVDSLKALNAHPNHADGQIANSLRGNLTNDVTSKPRPWLDGQSINGITKPMQWNDMKGYPATRWSR